MARTNVLVHAGKNIVTVQAAEEGFSDRLFSAGVRVHAHCLNLTEALNVIRSSLNHDVYSLDNFKEAVFEEDDGATGVRWVGHKAPFGETTDKGVTITMLTERKKWI